MLTWEERAEARPMDDRDQDRRDEGLMRERFGDVQTVERERWGRLADAAAVGLNVVLVGVALLGLLAIRDAPAEPPVVWHWQVHETR